MHSLSGFVASYVLNALWEVALIFLVACVASRILRRLGPQAEHAVWVSALIAAVISPALPTWRQAHDLILRSPAAVGGAGMVLGADAGSSAAHSGILSIPQEWLWILLAVYVVAAGFSAVRLIVSLAGAARLLRKANPALLGEEYEDIWEKCGRAYSLHGPRIMTSADAPGPVALDLGGPVLLMPADFAVRCSPEQFQAALAHECAHLKRRDFQKNLFYETASLAIAFHPLAWVIKSHIAQTREMICDAMATEGQVDARIYVRSLLRLAELVAASPRVSTVHAIGIFDAGILEKRIMRIRMKKHNPGTVARWCLMTAAGAMLVSTAAGAASMAVVVAPQAALKDAAQANSYGHVYRVGHGVSAPVPLKTAQAEFPKSFHNDKKRFDETVLLHLIVDAQGMPQDVRVARSYRPDFDAEAVKAVRKYQFRPAMFQGKPVAVSINIEVHFKMY